MAEGIDTYVEQVSSLLLQKIPQSNTDDSRITKEVCSADA